MKDNNFTPRLVEENEQNIIKQREAEIASSQGDNVVGLRQGGDLQDFRLLLPRFSRLARQMMVDHVGRLCHSRVPDKIRRMGNWI